MGADRFRDILLAAIRHFAESGYASPADLNEWLERLRMAAEREMPGADADRERMRREFAALFLRLTAERSMNKAVPGVSRYTLDRVGPELRAELDRRIIAATDLIRLNREAAVAKTLQRFSGWSTAIPKGGLSDAEKRGAATDIGKSVAQVKFEARRVAIDQGHKLAANVTDIVARSDGAIAVIWHSRWRVPGYNYRPDHKERDGQVYLIRGSWALNQGLIKTGKAGYIEDITLFGQEPFCMCKGQYLTSLRRLPEDMLTRKGRAALEALAA